MLNDACFWHALKSSGTFVWRYMAAHGGSRVGQGHDPAWYKKRLGIEVAIHFGVIRNPWDWYASWYRHCSMMMEERGGRVIREYSDGEPNFERTICNVTRPSGLVVPPTGLWVTDTGYPSPSEKEGLWSWYVRYMYFAKRAKVDFLIASDRVTEGLEEGLGWRLSPSESVPHNTSNMRERRGEPPASTNYMDWYSSDMVERVARVDRVFIERFGFRPFEKSVKPVFWLK